MSKKKLHTLVIEKFVAGGFGLGRLEEGIIVLVRHVLPGEKVLVSEVGRKKDYIAAALKEVLGSSPDRIKPPCPIYGRCGGCDLQHAGPEAQIRLKKAILADSLQRAAGNIFSAPELSMEPPRAAPQQFGYRQRIRLQVDNGANYGFFRFESHFIEPVSQCLLAKDELNRVLLQLHSSSSFKGLLTHCNALELLFNPEKNAAVMLLHFLRKPRPTDCLHAADLANSINGLADVLMQVKGYGLYDAPARTFIANPPILSHILSADTIKVHPLPGRDNTPVYPVPNGINLSWEAGGFCQVNLEQNSSLIKLVVEMAASGPHNRVLDLYCGYGNFSLPIAGMAEEVLGIDVQNAAIRSAKRNARLNNVHNCRFEKNQVPVAVESLVSAGKTFATIILDPPRQGAPDVVSLLPKLGPDQIIYISCNPVTLARDLALLHPAGFQLSRLVPLDMFPQTHHLESIALLKKSTCSPKD